MVIVCHSVPRLRKAIPHLVFGGPKAQLEMQIRIKSSLVPGPLPSEKGPGLSIFCAHVS